MKGIERERERWGGKEDGQVQQRPEEEEGWREVASAPASL